MFLVKQAAKVSDKKKKKQQNSLKN